jgi:hypothetical protein
MSRILRAVIASVAGVLGGSVLFGGMYFSLGGLTSQPATMIILLIPIVFGLGLGYHRDNIMPEGFLYCGCMLAVEAVAITHLAPLPITVIAVGFTAIVCYGIGRMACIFADTPLQDPRV